MIDSDQMKQVFLEPLDQRSSSHVKWGDIHIVSKREDSLGEKMSRGSS